MGIYATLLHKYLKSIIGTLFMNKNILIIGSGWLGWPLAQYLTLAGHQVTATTTCDKKVIRLGGTTPALIKLNANDPHLTGRISALPTFDIMIIVVPPQRQQADYLYQLQQLVKLADANNISHILFISSTGVYGQQSGIVTESTATVPTSDSAQAMADFEQALLIKGSGCHSVLRLAGLFGPGRHPGKFLAGNVDISNPEAVVNMIHQQDCIGLIEQIIMQNSWGRIHLGCAPSHPTRREFHQQGASQLALTVPQFVAKGGEQSKLVDGAITANKLGYRYNHPDLMDWFKQQ